MGSKFDRCIHPTVEDGSLHHKQQERARRNPLMMSVHMVMMDAMNLRTLLVCLVMREGGGIKTPGSSSG